MAITKSDSYKGLTVPNAYYKVPEFKMKEMKPSRYKDSTYEGKLYTLYFRVFMYTDSTKTHELEDDTLSYVVTDVAENKCTLPEIYKYLKNLEEFNDATDA